jgi:NitT/TauT family transport system substrate-binding protein
LAGAAGLFAYDMRTTAAEPPPEITHLRLVDVPLLCVAPQYLAEDLLRAEGFSRIEYVKAESAPPAVAAGLADMSQWGAPESLPLLDKGRPIVVVAGIHAGCWELFANERVHAIRDLEGKKIAISGYGSGDHVMLSSMLAYVGIDPRKEIDWIVAPGLFGPIRLFEEGKADAAFAFPPAPQHVRAKGIGRVIVDTARDRP